ncbi:bifunctional lysylphosphatidylglycerol flippase/synthetase MprF [Corynebacterium timonense]|uniref:Lysylphosphatidylglycerol synthetase, C-terminal domain, DUF2156 family n=1 Tax=Corynebacterium timonense TaxID=441500 RepID=A0A1H1Q1Q1_9CORY|nr:DUF2156 domain-containing protein [Corynebacterium timonense]SDS17412.1 Lysylphosphatidylglycerol synthetase, C-terminal domain, DUF2156 family [Corynebacterium timonense]
MNTVRSIATRVPASLVMLVVMWGAYALLGADALRVAGYSRGGGGNAASVLTSGLTSWHLAGMLYATCALLLFAVPGEVILGTRVFVVVALAVHAVAVPVGAVAASVVEAGGLNPWGADAATATYASPMAWIVGSLAYATAELGVLWRRRLRLVLFALTGTLVLYDGSLTSVVSLSAVLLGCAAGIMVHGGLRTLAPLRVSLRESRVLVAVLFAVVAFGPALTALNPAAHGPFAQSSMLMWEPAVAAEEVAVRCANATSHACLEALMVNRQSGLGPFLLNIAPLLFSLVVARGLARGRRLAWVLAMTGALVACAVIVAQIGRVGAGVSAGVGGAGVDAAAPLVVFTVVVVLVPWLAVVCVLAATRSRFRVRSQSALAVGPAAAALAVCALVWVVGALLDPGFVQPPSFGAALAETPLRFLPPVVAHLFPHAVVPLSAASWILYEWVGIAFWAALIVGVHRALVSVPSATRATERERARGILTRGTGDHLAWMGLWNGTRYFFHGSDGSDGSDGSGEGYEGYVAYRVARGVAVTLGAPVYTNGASRDAVAAAFEDYAAEQGWRVAWYSVPEDFARPGFRTVRVAEEALMSTDNLEFKGKKFQNIRTARNRAAKDGIRAVWTDWSELDVETREKIAALSEQWMAEKALPEMGFTLGSLDELQVEGTKLLLAVGDDTRVHGVTSWLPVYEGGELVGYTLDFMRRDPDGFRPTVEFLLAEAAVIAGSEGLAWVSLSGAPLARSGAPESLPEVILDRAGASIEPLYGFRSLAASKYKFHPTHSGWYLAYDDELALGAIAVAVVSCYLPTLKPADYVGVVKEFLASRHAVSAAESSPASAPTGSPSTARARPLRAKRA